jgi:uncharacterized membrane protein
MRVNDVPISNGGVWIKEAFNIFRAQPLQWLALMFAWVLASLALIVLVPFIGGAISKILQPAFFAGFMLACRDQEAGKRVTPAHLFAALRVNARALIAIGGLVLLLEGTLAISMSALGFQPVFQTGVDLETATNALRASLEGKGLLLTMSTVIATLIMGIFWFTAPLLAFHDMPPTHAIRWSFFAFFSNILPMVFFAILVMGMMFIGALSVGLALIAVMPLFMISSYTSYKNVFAEN